MKMMKLITKAHCSLATNEDGSKYNNTIIILFLIIYIKDH